MTDTTTPITTGMSGAEVFSFGGTEVLKTVRLGDVNDPSPFLREAEFYRFAKKHSFPFIPEILSIEETPDKLSIRMKQYRPVSHKEADDTLLPRLAQTLAEIHTAPIPDFLPPPDCAPLFINDADRQNCEAGWISVLNEHSSLLWKKILAAKVLHSIRTDINEINRRVFRANFTLNHGDFHLGNCLMDEENRLIVCDWQNVSVGNPAGDLSFFLSRLSADGTPLDKDRFIRLYCGEYAKRNPAVNPEQYRTELENAMLLSELDTSFLFWHQYLHGSAEERVAGVFGKMAEARERLTQKF